MSEDLYGYGIDGSKPCCPEYPNLMRLMEARGDVRGLTADEACAQARAQLAALDGRWTSATCAAIKTNVCSQPTLFVGTGGAAIRCALGCPNPDQVSSCEGTPGPGGDNTMIVVGAIGIAAIAGLGMFIASRGSAKKIMIARIP